jgi:DNA-binding transcriptional MerR regulator
MYQHFLMSASSVIRFGVARNPFDQRIRRQGELMTVGELSRRTGLSIKAIREYEALGLICSAGRSESNYRLFDDTALWCAGVIERLRTLGLTIKEIRELALVYDQAGERVEPELDRLLERAERRADAQIGELPALRRRMRAYRGENSGALGANLAAGAAPPPSRSS